MRGLVARRRGRAVFQDTIVRRRRLESLGSKPGNANLPIGEGRDANREIGVPRFRKTAMRAVYFAGGGSVTSAVIFRIMPSDLLKT
jgi:hypothetical protein